MVQEQGRATQSPAFYFATLEQRYTPMAASPALAARLGGGAAAAAAAASAAAPAEAGASVALASAGPVAEAFPDLVYSTTVKAESLRVFGVLRKAFVTDKVVGQRSCDWGRAVWDDDNYSVWVPWIRATKYRNAQQYFS